VAVALAAAGCGGDLPKASLLERTRVLGARVHVDADPGRADALPGETAPIEWLVAGPRAPAALAWAFALCTGIDGACADTPAMPVGGTGLPIVTPFLVPALGGDAQRPLALGAVCDGGAPGWDPAAAEPTCGGGAASATVARFDIPTPAAGAAPNRHPALANDVVELAGAPWDAMPAGDAGEPCDTSGGLPLVTAGSPELRIRLVTDADDRETFPPAPGATPQLEELQLSSFATAGELAGSYETIPASDTRPDADLVARWTPPAAADVPPGGLTVQFHLVVRDGRGGLDWLHRALCAVAP
jgi:hypothetical protein